jgi:cytochrome c-type biogenesis protein CcmE
MFFFLLAFVGTPVWIIVVSLRRDPRPPISKIIILGVAVPVFLGINVILGTVCWLAASGAESSKSYYVTIAELGGMGDKAYHSNLRVEGFVEPGSIERNGPHVEFVLNEFESHSPKAASGRLLKVSYKGSEPPPDTFKDDAQALAEGTYGRDGVLHATVLQAKCASKYAPAQPSAPATKPATATNAAPAPPSSTQTAAN